MAIWQVGLDAAYSLGILVSRTLHKSCSAHRRPRLLRTPGGGVQCQLFLPAHCLTGKATDEIVDRRQTVYYTALGSRPADGLSCHKGTNVSIARTPPAELSGYYARTVGQRKFNGKPFGYAHVSMASYADANNRLLPRTPMVL